MPYYPPATSSSSYVHPNHSGDVTSVGDGATTIAADAVTFAKMQNITGPSVLGFPTTLGPGDTSEIIAGNDGDFLQRLSSVILFDKQLFGTTIFGLSGSISPEIKDNENDWSPTDIGTSSVLHITVTGGPFEITGINSNTNADGRIIILQYASGTEILTLRNDSGSSTDTNRFAFLNNVVLTLNDVIILQYDSSILRWRMIGATRLPFGVDPNTVCEGNDARLSDSRTPSGSAGGDLGGSYPDPTINNDAVTYAKIQNISAASKLLGRGSAGGSGDPEEITLGTNLTMSATTLSATGGSLTYWKGW